MVRPRTIKNCTMMTLRISQDDIDMLKDIAQIQSHNTDRTISIHQLIREAIKFVYWDGEKLRECFRRSRTRLKRKYRENA